MMYKTTDQGKKKLLEVDKVEFLRILRGKLHFLEGFAAGVENKQLYTFVSGFRELCNCYERNQEVKDDATASN